MDDLKEIQTDIKNALDARERVHVLNEALRVKRIDVRYEFLRKFAGDIAAVAGSLDQAFVDAQFAQFTGWKTVDMEMGSRIDALTTIAAGLELMANRGYDDRNANHPG